MITITFTASTNYVGSKMKVEVEYEEEDWEAMSENEKYEEAMIALCDAGLEINWEE